MKSHSSERNINYKRKCIFCQKLIVGWWHLKKHRLECATKIGISLEKIKAQRVSNPLPKSNFIIEKERKINEIIKRAEDAHSSGVCAKCGKSFAADRVMYFAHLLLCG